MEKNNNLIVPIILFVFLIIGCGVIVSNKVLETKKEKVEEKQTEVQESKEPEQDEKKDIGNPTLAKDKVEKDVEKYIKDTDYESVSLYDKEVKELYKKLVEI